MSKLERAAWVEPPEPIRGLDHLGVQAPCIALYGQLLPGVTNVTDRARYYSFHPWVIWSFEKRYKDHSLDQFRRVLRRAECLFTLIAIRHARKLADNNDARHGKAMVGRDKLMRIDEASTISLDDYAGLEGPNRYFKNKLGALGQYYFGPLRDLRVLDHSPQGPGVPPGYDRERGKALAEAFGNGVTEERFFRALEEPVLLWTALDELAPFCPCNLQKNPTEYELLLDLFLARSKPFQDDDGPVRRASLGLMLDLASRTASDSTYDFLELLRGSAYSGALPDGSPWQVVPTFQRAQSGWGTYQRNELLSLSVQGLFSSVLRAIERDRAGAVSAVADAADVCAELMISSGYDPKLALRDVVAQVQRNQPPISDWQNSGHEIQMGLRLQGLSLNNDHIESIARESLAILLALTARGIDDYPYRDFDLDQDYFAPDEINLLTLRRASKNEWAEMTMETWCRWLAMNWGINQHLRIALRKLRNDRRDTFRIRPLEGELRVVEAPEPTYTVPRVNAALQILRDLGLLEHSDTKGSKLTERGHLELEACRGK